jgi:hypothetical protein
MGKYMPEIFLRLSPLVFGRVYPVTFPQQPLPVWPAIRYTPTGGAVQQTSCGDAMDGDVSIQIDVVALKFSEVENLSDLVRSAMNDFSEPAVLDREPSFDFDAETKTHRVIMSYTIAGSSNF